MHHFQQENYRLHAENTVSMLVPPTPRDSTTHKCEYIVTLFERNVHTENLSCILHVHIRYTHTHVTHVTHVTHEHKRT